MIGLGEVFGVLNKILGFFSPKERKRRIKDAIKKLERRRKKKWKVLARKYGKDKDFLLIDRYDRKISELDDALWNYEY